MTAQAQQTKFGIKGGINFSNFNDENFNDLVGADLNLKSNSGLMVGAFFNVASGPFSIQPEVLYTQKGADFAGGGSVSLDYLEVPLLLKFVVLPGPIQPNFFAGPYVGFVLESKADIAGINLDFQDDSQTDWGGILGVGINFNLAVTEIFVEGRYEWGFSNTYSFNIPFVEDVSLGSKNSVFALAAGIAF
jgi:hypothetical protein